MKKNNLFKAVGIVILIYILMSWIVPIIYSVAGIDGEVSYQIGFVSILSVLLETFSGFGTVILYVLLVGAFYGVLKATGAYDKLIELLSSKANGREKGVLIGIIVLMAVISSISGLDLGLLVVFPILISLIVKMGYDKLVALSATLGATVIGMYGATFAGTLYGLNNTVLNLKTFDQFIPKLIFLVVGVVGLVLFVLMYCKKKNFKLGVSENEEVLYSSKDRLVVTILAAILGGLGVHRFYVGKVKTGILYLLTGGLFGIGYLIDLIMVVCGAFTDKEGKIIYFWTDAEKQAKKANSKAKKDSKKSNKSEVKDSSKSSNKKVAAVKKNNKEKKERTALPALIIVGIVMLLFFVGTTSWEGIFGSNWFSSAHESWTGFKIGGFDILNKLFGGVDAFGSWNTPVRFQVYSMILIVAMVILAIVYRTKADECFEGFVDGIKSFVVPAILTILACSLFVFIYYNPVLTPVSSLLLGKDFNVALTGIYTIINSVFYVDYYYLAYSVLYSITSVYSDSTVLSIISVMFTNLYSLVMLVAPTSILLLITLSISDVKYTEWFKFIWKLALALLVVSFIVFSVMLLI